MTVYKSVTMKAFDKIPGNRQQLEQCSWLDMGLPKQLRVLCAGVIQLHSADLVVLIARYPMDGKILWVGTLPCTGKVSYTVNYSGNLTPHTQEDEDALHEFLLQDSQLQLSAPRSMKRIKHSIMRNADTTAPSPAPSPAVVPPPSTAGPTASLVPLPLSLPPAAAPPPANEWEKVLVDHLLKAKDSHIQAVEKMSADQRSDLLASQKSTLATVLDLVNGTGSLFTVVHCCFLLL